MVLVLINIIKISLANVEAKIAVATLSDKDQDGE